METLRAAYAMAKQNDRAPIGEDFDRVKRLNELGVARVVPMFPPEKADKVLTDRRPVDEAYEGGQRLVRRL
jgi:hypothetical protein